MMFTLFTLAAAQAAQELPVMENTAEPPRLINSESVVTLQDYPNYSLNRGESGVVSITIQVSVNGKASACDITESSGHSALDMTTCRLFKLRGRFAPARDATGAAVPGEYHESTSWAVDEPWQRNRIELPLQLSRVPSYYQSPVKARLIFDAAGRVSACEITQSSGSKAADRVVCAFAKEQLTIPAPKSVGNDVPALAVRYLVSSLSGPVEKPSGQQ